MSLKALIYIISLLLIICSLYAVESFGQETTKISTLSTKHNNINLKLKTEKEFSVFSFRKVKIQKFHTNLHAANNLKNFPFQLGIEIGRSVRLNYVDDFTKIGLIGYMDFSVYKRTLFIKLEGGAILLNDEVESQSETFDRKAMYIYAGLNIIFLRFKKHRLALSAGLGIISKGFLPFLSSTLRYLYVINRLIGVSFAVKYPFIRGDNPYLPFGLQFFNN